MATTHAHPPTPSRDTLVVPVPRSASTAERLLRAGVPLSLLLDLAGSDPHSEELYRLELSS